MGRGQRTTAVLAAAVGILLLASTSAAVARAVADRRPSAEALLKRVDRYTRDHGTVRFTGHTEIETRSVEDRRGRLPDEEADSFTARSTVEGVASFPDRARVTGRSNGSTTEIVQVGDRSFARHAEDGDDLSDEQWVVFGPGEEGSDLAGGGGAAGLNDPSALRDLIADASAPEVVWRDRRLSVIRATVDVHGDDLPSDELGSLTGTMELTAAGDGRLDRMVVEVRGEADDGSSFDARVDVSFSGWGDPVGIDAPDDRSIDATPSIDEERVGAYRDAPLLQPAGIPERWVLDFADVIPAEDTLEECDQVEVDYIDPDDEEAGYLYLFQLPVTCADPKPPAGAQPFRAGANRGWITVDPEDGVQAQLVVGRTVLQADTDLVPAELARVLAQLVPLDLSVTPAGIPGLGRTRA